MINQSKKKKKKKLKIKNFLNKQWRNVIHTNLDKEEMESMLKRSRTSFGKLILADEKTSPQYSIIL